MQISRYVLSLGEQMVTTLVVVFCYILRVYNQFFHALFGEGLLHPAPTALGYCCGLDIMCVYQRRSHNFRNQPLAWQPGTQPLDCLSVDVLNVTSPKASRTCYFKNVLFYRRNSATRRLYKQVSLCQSRNSDDSLLITQPKREVQSSEHIQVQ